MDLRLKDKVSIITGGGSGIGKAIALTFAEEGSKLVIADVDEGRGKAVTEEIQSTNRSAVFTKTDVTKWEDTVRMAEAVVKEFGQIDILVNNAGAFRSNFFMQMSREDWDYEINGNYYVTLNCTRAVLEHMIHRKSGCIINIGSDAGRIGEPNQPVYSGAKGAIIAFSKALAKDVARHSIRVNTVCPSLTMVERRVEMEEELRQDPEKWKEYEGWKEKAIRMYPLRRLNEPQDLANMVVFLASDRARQITGQTISVNAGYSMI